jgi:hypothetical protein
MKPEKENNMALPPIITGSPLFKALTGAPSRAETPSPTANESGKASPRDTVSLSDDALRKLEEMKSNSVSTADEAREKAGEIRADLEENPDIVLGLDNEDSA